MAQQAVVNTWVSWQTAKALAPVAATFADKAGKLRFLETSS